MKRLHRLNAIVLALFLALHLANHISIIGGTDNHIIVQDTLRPLYRAIPVEIVLWALFLIQAGLGLHLVRKRWRIEHKWARLQVWSGAYLGFFIVIHLGAVALARWEGVETNVHFAGAGLHLRWLWLFFAPYYILAVASLFAHFAAVLFFNGYRKISWLLWLGMFLGSVIVAGMLGIWGGELPPDLYLDRLRFWD